MFLYHLRWVGGYGYGYDFRLAEDGETMRTSVVFVAVIVGSECVRWA
ncbi:hypothetical protein HanPSC8_Chr07g0272041 [Helianthus annuus]|nr:hypothetical protein HanPSC8_Chr07g0272041 [Helianthus annuus]